MAAEPLLTPPTAVVPSDPESHLRFLFGSNFDGYLEVTTIIGPNNTRTRSFTADRLHDAAAHIARESETWNVFFAYGLQAGPVPENHRGKADTVTAIPCLWFDLDHFNVKNPDAHAEKKLPGSRETALEFVASFTCPPTMVINSGNGLYAVWVFNSLWTLTTSQERERAASLSKRFHKMIRDLGLQHGWKFDNTSNLNCLTRAVGSVNRKGNPLSVKLVSFKGHRYHPAELEALLPETPLVDRPPPANDNTPNNNSGSADPDLILSACPWCAHCRNDAATLPEPEWKALATIIVRCRDGRQRFHELSHPYLDYDPAETESKIDQSIADGGPYRCDTIEGDLNDAYCAQCNFRGRVSSPIVLGQPLFNTFKDWAYVGEEDAFYNLRFSQVLNRTVFTEMTRHLVDKRQVPHVAFNSSKATTKVDRTEFAPEKPKFFRNGGAKIMNVWSPPTVIPVEGDPSVFLDHLTYLVPDDEERYALLNTLAYIVQFPGRLLGYMTLIKGQAGTGKSYLGQVLSMILGREPIRVIRTEDLRTQWSDWIVNAAVVIIEELMAGGRMEIANRIKAMITEPVVRIEGKYLRSREVKNTAKFLAFTNHDVATYVPPDDRRTFYIASQAAPRDPTYYGQLWGWTSENVGVIYSTLLNRDLTQFDPMTHAPMTDAKRQLVEDSRPPIDGELIEMMDQGIPPFHRDVVRSEEVREALCFRGGDFARTTTRKVGQSLRNLGATRLEQVSLQDGSRPRLWVIRNHDHWAVNLSGNWQSRDPEAIRAELLKSAHIRQG